MTANQSAVQWVDASCPLIRYGVKWNGPTEPICEPMPDGYWTPWHAAHEMIERLRIENRALADTAANAINEKQALQVELFNLRGRK